MATVFLARDLRHDRLVALKVLDPELGAVLGVERFLSEIRVTANLQHANLLPLFDSGEADGMLFYVMPFVDGESLRARLDREKQLPVEEGVRFAVAIATALDYAHEHGIVHRDLKPENILIHHGEPVVADFGIALAVSNAGGNRVTQTGLSLGTPQYMSPEQAMGDRTIDRRSDIYSLAAVLYEMIGGEAPHSGSSGQAVIAKLMTEEPRRLSALRKSVPPHVEAAVHRGLEKLPADRWSSAREFAEALRGTRAVAALPSSTTTTSATRHRIAMGVAVAAAMIAVIEGALLARSPAPKDEQTLRFTLVTPDSQRFLPAAPAIPLALSADDRRVAYIGSAPHGSVIYVADLDDMRSHALPGTERALSPVFSPDGKWVAANLGDRIARIPVDGGEPVTILNLNGAPNAGIVWSDPDTIVASVGGALDAVPVNGGPPVVLSRPDSARGETQQWGPRVIDARYVAYIAVGAAGLSSNRIAILDRKTGRTAPTPYLGTTIVGVVDKHLIWVQTSGTVMAAVVARDGTIGSPQRVLEDVLVRPGGAAKVAMSNRGTLIYARGISVSQPVLVDEHGVKTPLGVDAHAFSHPRWSPDGSRIVVTVSRSSGSDLWLIDARTKGLSRLTTGSGIDDQPAWTADSKRVIYRSIEPSGTRLKWIAADGSEPAPSVLVNGGDPYSGFVTADGKSLVFRTGDLSPAFRKIFVMPLSGTRAVRPLVSGAGSYFDPSVSPDGRWLVYTSDVSGANQVYLRPFDAPGAPIQISDSPALEPAWSRDGHAIFYRSGRAVVEATLAGAPSVSARSQLFEGAFINDGGYRDYDVAPDGKHLLMLESVDRQSETIVVYNWAAELRRAWR